jgi:hypothetical protein
MPDAYFKYYKAKSLKQTLSTATRKWSSPSEFNDPFDNRLDIQWTGDSIDLEIAAREKISRLVEEENPDLTSILPLTRAFISTLKAASPVERSARLAMLKEPKGIYTPDVVNAMHANINKLTERFLSDIYIFCLSKSYKNLLMWAHYADKHYGGVIKFLPVKKGDFSLVMAKKVNYSRNIPSIKFADLHNNTKEFSRTVIEAITLTKSIAWRYEKEWRVVTKLKNSANKCEILPFAEEEVGGLYLGCRMLEPNKAELIEIMTEKYPWAPIYEAVAQRNKFSLTFKQIKGLGSR